MENESDYAQQMRPSMHGSNSSNFQYKMESIFGHHVHIQPKSDTLCESDLVRLLMMLDGYVSHKVESLFEGRWSAAYIQFWTRKHAETAVTQIRSNNFVANLVLDKLMSYYKLESLKRIERELSNCCTTIIVGESGICRRNARLSHAILLKDFSVFGDPLKIQTQKYDHAEISFSTFAEALAAYIANNRWEHINQFCPPSLYYWVKIEIKEKELSLFQRYSNIYLNSNLTSSDGESVSENSPCDSPEIAIDVTSNPGNRKSPAYQINSSVNAPPHNSEISSDFMQRETFYPDVIPALGAQTDAKINIQNQTTNIDGRLTKTDFGQPTEHWYSCFNPDPYMPSEASNIYPCDFPQNSYFNSIDVPTGFPNQTPINQQTREFSQYTFNSMHPKQLGEINELEKIKNYSKQLGSANFNYYDQISHLTENTSFLQNNVSQSIRVKNHNASSLLNEQAHSQINERYNVSCYSHKKLRANKKDPLGRLNSMEKRRRK